MAKLTQLQILRSSVENKRPDPELLLPGQPAVNINPNQPGLFFADSNSPTPNLFKVGPCYVGEDPPNDGATPPGATGNSKGEFWYDTANEVLKVWDGTTWKAGADGVGSITVGDGLDTDVPGNVITESGTIFLPETGVVPASYTSANITVDEFGRITAASNGGGGFSVDTFTYTTSPLATNAFEDFEVDIGKLYQVLTIETDYPAWLRIFGNASGRAADTRVMPGLPFPAPGSGYFSEVVTTLSGLSIFMSPIVSVQQETTDTYFKIQNNDAATQEITVTLTVVVLVP